MNKEQKEFLLSYMDFFIKLDSKDNSITNDIIILTNSNMLTDEHKNKIEEAINNIVAKDGFDKDFITNVIKQLSFVDVEYLNAMVEIMTIDISNRETMKTYVKDILAKNFNIKNENNKFTFYHSLSNLAILTRDSELIKECIDKVQSL